MESVLLKRGELVFRLSEYKQEYEPALEATSWSSALTAYRGSKPVGCLKFFFKIKDKEPKKPVFVNQDMRVRSGERGKGYCSALVEVANEYVLGKLGVKPPFKAVCMTGSGVISRKLGRKLVDIGHFPEGAKPNSPIYSVVGKKTFSGLSDSVVERVYPANKAFLLKRRAFRKGRA